MGYYFSNIWCCRTTFKYSHEYGLEAIEYWPDKFPDSLHPRFPEEFVLESVKFILETNNLNFDNEFFDQSKDTAMGTIFALTYANLTMEFFELTFHDIGRDKFGEPRVVFSMTVKPYQRKRKSTLMI